MEIFFPVLFVWRAIKKKNKTKTQRDSVPCIQTIFQIHYRQGIRRPQVPFLWGKVYRAWNFMLHLILQLLLQKIHLLVEQLMPSFLTFPMEKEIAWIELKPLNQKRCYLKEFVVLLMYLVLYPPHSTPEARGFVSFYPMFFAAWGFSLMLIFMEPEKDFAVNLYVTHVRNNRNKMGVFCFLFFPLDDFFYK